MPGNGTVELGERGDEALDDGLAREAGLASEGIDALGGRHRPLVAELLPADAQHVGHDLTVHVVAEGRVVQHAPVGQALLRGPADLPVRSGAVVAARTSTVRGKSVSV